MSRARAIPLTADLVLHIRRIIACRGLTQSEAAAITGITQPNLSAYLKHNHRHRPALPRLLRCLNALGSDVEITITPTDKKRGEISLTCEDRFRPSRVHAGQLHHHAPARLAFPPSRPDQPALTRGEGFFPLNARLANHICRTLDQRSITRGEAASIFGTSRQQVSDLYHLRPRKFGLQRLLLFLNLLNQDVEITVTPAGKERGETFLTIL